MRPLVSILTPSFQQARFLPDCLDSVAAQTYEPLEHVVADGGSDDGTREILEATPHPIDWRSEPDDGQADAINKAFGRSAGEIVGWINSDDALFAVDAVEEAVGYFDRHPEVGVVAGDAALMDRSRQIVGHFRPRVPWGSRLNPLSSPLSQPATFVRRSAIEEAGGLLRPDFHLTLDLELWLRLRSHGIEFGHLPRVLAADRDHPERKVRVLQETAARDEYVRLTEMYGVRFEFSARDRIVNWRARWAGVPEVASWRRRYEPAFNWRVDGRAARIRRQLFQSYAGNFRLADRD